jgi:uncharacterized protein YjbJ (UPF0337 family)
MTMGLDDRLENTAQDLAGRGKEAVGAATDDESLKSEGKADQLKAGLKDKVEDVSDKAQELKDKIKDKVDDVL